MSTLITFIDILASLTLALCCGRLYALHLLAKENDPIYRLAAAFGKNPIGDAVVRTLVIAMAAGAWFCARFWN